MSDSAERSAGSDRTHLLRKRIAQLEAEVRALRKQVQAGCELKKCGVGGKVLPIPVVKS